MKKTIWTVLSVALVALLTISCAKEYDDTALKNKVDNLEQRVASLEEKVNQDIAGIQTAINALNAKLTVSSVSKTDDGWVIRFSDGTTATLSNGAKGADAVAPVVAIASDGKGGYVWTINGVVAEDAQGNPYPVMGPQGEAGAQGYTPHLKLEGAQWYVSYDYVDAEHPGTWIAIGQIDYPQTVVTVDSESDPANVIITIDGTVVNIPKELAFSLKIDVADLSGVGIDKGGSIALPYEVVGALEGDNVTVDVIFTSAGLSASIIPPYIKITADDATDTGKVVVYADNGKGKTSIKVIKLEAGVLAAVADVDAQVTGEGGVISLDVATNKPYNVNVSAGAEEWITIQPATKAHTDKLEIVIAANATPGYRVGSVTVTDDATADVIAEFNLVQQPAYDGTPTTLSTIADLPDGAAVVVEAVTVVAASATQAVITDGAGNIMYVDANGLTAGSVVKITAVKASDAAKVAYLKEATVEAQEGTPAEIDAHDFFYYYDYVGSGDFTVAIATLSKDGDNYLLSVDSKYSDFIIAGADAQLDALEGKMVSVKGWGTSIVPGSSGAKDIIRLIPVSISEFALTSQSGWITTYDGAVSGNANYPEQISVKVGALPENEFVMVNVVSEQSLNGADPESKLIDQAASFQYTITYYGFRGYDFNTVMNVFAHNGDFTETFEAFDPGKYYILVQGIDGDAAFTGKYAIQEFEKENPYEAAAYDEFIGDWMLDKQPISITEKDKGVSYYITGLTDQKEAWTIVADYDEGTLSLSEQVVASENDGATVYYLTGLFVYNSSLYFSYPSTYSSGPDVLFKIAKLKNDGGFEILPGINTNYEYDFGAFLFTTWENGSRTAYTSIIYMPESFTPYVPVVEPEAIFKDTFEDASTIANWTLIDADQDGNNWIRGAARTHSGSYVLYSESYANSKALTPNNWAFTPAINFTTGNYLSFWITAQDPSYYAEHYAVYITESPEASSTAQPLFEDTLWGPGTSAQPYLVDYEVWTNSDNKTGYFLRFVIPVPEAFANKTGYVGFRHFDCTDMFLLNVDDVAVYVSDPMETPATAPAAKPAVKTSRKMVEKPFRLRTETPAPKGVTMAVKEQQILHADKLTSIHGFNNDLLRK